MIKIRFSTKFKKQYKKSDRSIQNCFNERLNIFLKDQNDVVLNNHGLTGSFRNYRSININGDWRAIYTIEDKNTATFQLMGTHSQLYK